MWRALPTQSRFQLKKDSYDLLKQTSIIEKLKIQKYIPVILLKIEISRSARKNRCLDSAPSYALALKCNYKLVTRRLYLGRFV